MVDFELTVNESRRFFTMIVFTNSPPASDISLFDPKDTGDIFLLNVGGLSAVYTACT
jgi:hypothetical protein